MHLRISMLGRHGLLRPESLQAGVEIMKKGGNAIDVVAATALAPYAEPYNIGIGGGITVRAAKTGEVVFPDFHSVVPASARKDMFASEQAQKESCPHLRKASGSPGFVAGLVFMRLKSMEP